MASASRTRLPWSAWFSRWTSPILGQQPLHPTRCKRDPVEGDGQGAAATATVGANGSITGLTLTSPGGGYTSATVRINPIQGSGSNAKSGSVTSVTIDTNPDGSLVGGSGYTAPIVPFTSSGGTGTLTQVRNQLTARQFATDYATTPGTLTPVFVVVPMSMPASGQVTAIQHFNQATNGSSPNPSAGEPVPCLCFALNWKPE